MVANKTDIAPEGGAGLSARLGLERLEGRVSRVQPASALSGAGVREGLQWLVEQVTLLQDFVRVQCTNCLRPPTRCAAWPRVHVSGRFEQAIRQTRRVEQLALGQCLDATVELCAASCMEPVISFAQASSAACT